MLEVVDREVWEDGTVVTWMKTPFLRTGRKPQVASSLHKGAKAGVVAFGDLIATQGRVTQEGVLKHMGEASDLPIVYRTNEGVYIADGHHRLTAAYMRGGREFQVLVVNA